jgi:hypothetical protein
MLGSVVPESLTSRVGRAPRMHSHVSCHYKLVNMCSRIAMSLSSPPSVLGHVMLARSHADRDERHGVLRCRAQLETGICCNSGIDSKTDTK